MIFLSAGLHVSSPLHLYHPLYNLISRVVADVVGDLKMMALEMGNELSTQNDKLDRINQKVCIKYGAFSLIRIIRLIRS